MGMYMDMEVLGDPMKKPGETVTVRITFTNTGNIDYTFTIGASIGNDSLGKWYDIAYKNVLVIAGVSKSVDMITAMPDDPDVKDAWGTVKKQDLTILDELKVYNVITYPIISAKINAIDVS